jgi:hypothetical protein
VGIQVKDAIKRRIRNNIQGEWRMFNFNKTNKSGSRIKTPLLILLALVLAITPMIALADSTNGGG